MTTQRATLGECPELDHIENKLFTRTDIIILSILGLLILGLSILLVLNLGDVLTAATP